MIEQDQNNICPHCKGDLRVRNPKGFCDHLKYPEYCDTCKLIREFQKDFPELANSTTNLRVWNDYMRRKGTSQLVGIGKVMEQCVSKDKYSRTLNDSYELVKDNLRLRKHNIWLGQQVERLSKFRKKYLDICSLKPYLK